MFWEISFLNKLPKTSDTAESPGNNDWDLPEPTPAQKVRTGSEPVFFLLLKAKIFKTFAFVKIWKSTHGRKFGDFSEN